MFRILIRGRNCEKYLKDCIKSLLNQGAIYKALIILDAPTDRSVLRAKQLINKFEMEKVDLIVRKKQMGLSYNLYNGIHEMGADEDDIIGILDADDWLSDNTLYYIQKKYSSNPGLLLTYGSYIKVSKGGTTKISAPYKVAPRYEKWHGSHFKTFKFSLFKNLPADCMKHKGKWLPAASDVALMIPLIELAGLKRCKWIQAPLYYWRDNTPCLTNRKLQMKCEKIIRKKPGMERVK